MEIKDRIIIKNPNFTRNKVAMDTRFRYEPLSAKYIDQVVEVFTTSFCRSEPMTKYLAMDEDKYRIFARSVTENALKDGLSVIAIDPTKDSVVACALTEDLASPAPLPDFDPTFLNILALLESLGATYFAGKEIPKGKIAHLFITAVDQNHRGLGLSRQINFHAMDAAERRGFQFVYCEFTHYFNEKGTLNYLRVPMQFVGNSIYKDFEHQGTRVFAELDGEANSYLWVISDKKIPFP